MFEELIASIRRFQAEFEFELARTEDMYRLAHLLKQQINRLEGVRIESDECVKELERGV